MIADTINYEDIISDLNYGSAVRCAERLSLSDKVAQFVRRPERQNLSAHQAAKPQTM